MYKSSKTYQKRLLLKTLFANCYLDGEKLVTTWVDAVLMMRTIGDYRKWQGHRDSNSRPTVLETVALPTELYPLNPCYTRACV